MKKTLLLILAFWLLWSFSCVFANCDFSNSTFEQERNEAYFWACKEWIIQDWTISSAKMNNELTRIEMAKILNTFSIKMIWKEEDPSITCNWYFDLTNNNDISIANRACHLWIMWIWIKNFRPNDWVTRAEFGTVLSRILYGDKYNVTSWKYYEKHLTVLKNNWIITNNNPNLKEKKWYILLMLKRYIDNLWKENENTKDSITVKNDNWYIKINGTDVTFSNNKDSITISNKYEKTQDWKRSDSLQWPCAPWYHVPSKDEAIKLINIRWEIRKNDLVSATILDWHIYQEGEKREFSTNAVWDIFISDILWQQSNASNNGPIFRTRSFNYNNNMPYSIGIFTYRGWSSVSVSDAHCWLWCKLSIICFKTN